MKKQMKWLIAALALAALATPAFAVTADMTGSLKVSGVMNNNIANDSQTQDHQRWTEQRLRLFTNVAANENVKAVVGLEVDNIWGRQTAGTGKEIGTMGSDAKGQLEIKHLYLDFKIPSLGANVKAGTQPFNFGRGLIINDDAAGLLVTLPCKVNPSNTIQLSWIKTTELSAVDNEDDGDFYGAKYSLKVGDLGIAPYLGYYSSSQAPTAGAPDLHAAFYGVDLDGKSGDLSYAATIIANQWSKGNVIDGSSVSLYGKAAYAMGATTLSLEAASYGDQDNGGQAMSLTQGAGTGPINNFSEILTGGQYTSNAGVNTNVDGAANLYNVNFQYLKVGVAQKLNDTMAVSASLAQIEQAEDTAPGVAAIVYGQEIDTYFDYTVVPGLKLNVAAAYLLADNDFSDDDVYKLATSLNYAF